MNMWGSKTKRKTAADKWHTKAMLVDPKKTKIIMISVETSNIDESTELGLGTLTQNMDTAELAPAPHAADIAENLETEEHNSEIDELTGEASDINDSTENLGTTEQNLETTELSSLEGLFAASSTEDLILEANVEAPMTQDSIENMTTEPSEETTKPNSAELDVECQNTELSVRPKEQNVVGTTNPFETNESTYMVYTDQEPLNAKFLRALEKTRILWDNDKQLTKIVQKMQKGKNLKRKEFDKVYFYIREYLQYC
jgi:hypothetical protein